MGHHINMRIIVHQFNKSTFIKKVKSFSEICKKKTKTKIVSRLGYKQYNRKNNN